MERVAVVTGAARGLGAALARGLAARGYRLALLGLEPGGLDVLRDACPGSARWEVDVTDGARLEQVAAEVLERFGRVDVVVANAGIAAGGTLLVSDPASYDRVVEVNLLGSIRTARAFLPALVDSGGYLLQVASIAALAPAPGVSAYCASKAGVESFAVALRGEVRHHGVDVGVAYLSWTDTDMVRGADARPGIGGFRTRHTGLLARTYPLEPTAARIVEGIERRSARVYGQRWNGALRLARWALPGLAVRLGSRRMAEFEAAVRRHGTATTSPVGAGGAADTASAGGRVTRSAASS